MGGCIPYVYKSLRCPMSVVWRYSLSILECRKGNLSTYILSTFTKKERKISSTYWLNMLTIQGPIINMMERDVNDHLMNMTTFTLITNRIFTRAPYITIKMAMGTIWICQSSCTNHVSPILQGSGCREKKRPNSTRPS